MYYHRRAIAKWICMSLTVWLLLTLQTMILPRFPLLGAHALPAVAAVVAVAVLEGKHGGASVGLFCGLVLDALIPPGEAFFAVFLLAAGYITGVVVSGFFQKNVWTALIWCAGLLFIMELLYFFIFFFMPGRAGWRAFAEAGLTEILLTLPFIPFVYLIFRLLHVRFAEK